MVNHGQIDDGFILEKGLSHHQFFMGFDSIIFGQFHTNTTYNLLIIPFYSGVKSYIGDYKFVLSASPMMLLPLVSLGYVGRWEVINSFEISLNAFISSPNPAFVSTLFSVGWADSGIFINIYWPGVSIGIGFKKKLKSNENISVSYKFNFGFDYTGDTFGAISLRNTFLFGRKREKSLLSFNTFINTCFKFGMPTIYGLWIVFNPGLEITSNIVAKNGVVFTRTFMIGYETDFIFYINLVVLILKRITTRKK